jgi:hypothetical protein
MDLHAAISDCPQSIIMQYTISAVIVYFVLHFHTAARKLRRELHIAFQVLNASYSYSESLTIALTKPRELACLHEDRRGNAKRRTREDAKMVKGAVS